MENINHVVISGNLTRNPDVRATATGLTILNFSVAVNERRKNSATGEWEDYANYIDCSMMGKRADAISPLLSKGTKVWVAGKLHWSQWQTSDGATRSKVEVKVTEIELAPRAQGRSGAPAAQVPAPEVYDENIPF